MLINVCEPKFSKYLNICKSLNKTYRFDNQGVVDGPAGPTGPALYL
jgi:hypothetical protein